MAGARLSLSMDTSGREHSDYEASLAEHYLPRLRVFTTRRLGEVAAGEDAAQETLRRVFIALREKSVRDLQALPAYIFEVARHVCFHHVRAERRAAQFQAPLSDVEDPRTHDADPLSALISSERVQLLRTALATLPQEDRELLRLTYVKGLTAEQIGERLGLSAGNVRVRRHRAKKMLKASVTSGSSGAPEEGARR